MKRLGDALTQKSFKIVKILHSPEMRTSESAQILNSNLRVREVTSNKDLDDTYAPGGYREKMSMDEFQKIGGNAYDRRWNKYHHEKPQVIIKRIEHVFQNTVRRLKSGETAVFLSHGDPIAWWINWKTSGKIPSPKRLRKLIYPNKGEALVLTINAQANIDKCDILDDPSLIKGKSY